jgi:hypothetical protein
VNIVTIMIGITSTATLLSNRFPFNQNVNVKTVCRNWKLRNHSATIKSC